VRFHIERSGHGWTLTGRGIWGLALLAAVLAIPALVSPRLRTDDAAERVRFCMMWQVTQGHLAELRETGQKLPDVATATRWEAERQRITATRFEAVAVRRPVPDWFRLRPTYVIKAEVCAPGAASRTRYFWLGRTHFGSETSKLAWWISA
jgi:hypothetical protein